jgi:hypothetical protein
MAKKAAKRPGRGSDKFDLRFPDGMRDQLYRLAEANGRSANSEIIERLRRSIESDNLKNLTAAEFGSGMTIGQAVAIQLKEFQNDLADLRATVEKLKQDRDHPSNLLRLKSDPKSER